MTYPIYLLHARIGKILFNILSQDLNKYVVLMTITLFVISLSFAVYTFFEKRLLGQISKLLTSALPSRLL